MPEELKSFHHRTMVVALGIALITFSFAIAGSYQQSTDPEKGGEFGFLAAGFIAGVLTLMGYFMYRACLAKPSVCPNCGGRLDPEGSMDMDHTKWRVFGCSSCSKKFRVPGLSVG